MFSSSSINGYNNHPFDPFMTNQTPPTPPYVASIIGNPNQNHYYYSPPFLNYPEAILDKKNDGDFLMSSTHLPLQQEILGSCCNLSPRKNTNQSVATNSSLEEKKKRKKKKGDGDCDGVSTKKAVPRKRLAGKKDRHSKIHTAQGIRDRRMRLSLKIAQKFFDLQDMLGFDRASKTIEWLFSKSRASIKELKDGFQVPNQNYPINPLFTNWGKKKDCNSSSSKICKKSLESMQKSKESRDNARARARERTMLKKMKLNTKDPLESGLENPIVGSDNQETVSNDPRKDEEEGEEGEEGGEFSNAYSFEHQMDAFSIMEDFLGIANYSPSFEYFSNYINGVINSESWNSTNDGVHDSSYCTIRGTKCSTGDEINLQVQNPNAILANDLIIPMNHSNDQEKNPNLVSLYELLNC